MAAMSWPVDLRPGLLVKTAEAAPEELGSKVGGFGGPLMIESPGQTATAS